MSGTHSRSGIPFPWRDGQLSPVDHTSGLPLSREPPAASIKAQSHPPGSPSQIEKTRTRSRRVLARGCFEWLSLASRVRGPSPRVRGAALRTAACGWSPRSTDAAGAVQAKTAHWGRLSRARGQLIPRGRTVGREGSRVPAPSAVGRILSLSILPTAECCGCSNREKCISNGPEHSQVGTLLGLGASRGKT